MRRERITHEGGLFLDTLPAEGIQLQVAREVEQLHIRVPGRGEGRAHLDVAAAPGVTQRRLPLKGGEWIGLEFPATGEETDLSLSSPEPGALRHVLVRVAARRGGSAAAEDAEVARIAETLVSGDMIGPEALTELGPRNARRVADLVLQRLAREPDLPAVALAPFLLLLFRIR